MLSCLVPYHDNSCRYLDIVEALFIARDCNRSYRLIISLMRLDTFCIQRVTEIFEFISKNMALFPLSVLPLFILAVKHYAKIFEVVQFMTRKHQQVVQVYHNEFQITKNILYACLILVQRDINIHGKTRVLELTEWKVEGTERSNLFGQLSSMISHAGFIVLSTLLSPAAAETRGFKEKIKGCDVSSNIERDNQSTGAENLEVYQRYCKKEIQSNIRFSIPTSSTGQCSLGFRQCFIRTINPPYPTETNMRVKRQKLLLSGYHLMMHYIKVEKNVGADAFSRMRFQNSSNSDVPPMDKLCAIADDPPCVMADLVLRAYHDEDLMIQKIKFSCLSGSNIFARYGIHHDTSGDKIIIKQST